jgi:uroporphyrinogen-III synthase
MMQATVLLTRSFDQGHAFIARLLRLGVEVVHWPCIDTVANTTQREALVSRVAHTLLACRSQACDMIFISPNSVRFFAPFFQSLCRQIPGFKIQRFFAVGRGTAIKLNQQGINPVITPQHPLLENSEGVLALDALQGSAVQDRVILLIQGQAGRMVLHDTLMERGGCVVPCPVYTRVASPGILSALPAYTGLKPYVTLISSGFVLEHLCAKLALGCLDKIRQNPVCVVGSRVRVLAHQAGFRRVYEAVSMQDDDLLVAIGEACRGNVLE